MNVLAELCVTLELLLDGEQLGGEVTRAFTNGGGNDPLLVDLTVDVCVMIIRVEVFWVAAVSEDALDVVVLHIRLVMK